MDAMTAYRQRRIVMAKYRGQCGYCLIRIAAHVHEIVPRSAGGQLVEENQIALCPQCHDTIHESGWTNHTEALYAAQARARALHQTDIQVGGANG